MITRHAYIKDLFLELHNQFFWNEKIRPLTTEFMNKFISYVEYSLNFKKNPSLEKLKLNQFHAAMNALERGLQEDNLANPFAPIFTEIKKSNVIVVEVESVDELKNIRDSFSEYTPVIQAQMQAAPQAKQQVFLTHAASVVATSISSESIADDLQRNKVLWLVEKVEKIKSEMPAFSVLFQVEYARNHLQIFSLLAQALAEAEKINQRNHVDNVNIEEIHKRIATSSFEFCSQHWAGIKVNQQILNKLEIDHFFTPVSGLSMIHYALKMQHDLLIQSEDGRNAMTSLGEVKFSKDPFASIPPVLTDIHEALITQHQLIKAEEERHEQAILSSLDDTLAMLKRTPESSAQHLETILSLHHFKFCIMSFRPGTNLLIKEFQDLIHCAASVDVDQIDIELNERFQKIIIEDLECLIESIRDAEQSNSVDDAAVEMTETLYSILRNYDQLMNKLFFKQHQDFLKFYFMVHLMSLNEKLNVTRIDLDQLRKTISTMMQSASLSLTTNQTHTIIHRIMTALNQCIMVYDARSGVSNFINHAGVIDQFFNQLLQHNLIEFHLPSIRSIIHNYMQTFLRIVNADIVKKDYRSFLKYYPYVLQLDEKWQDYTRDENIDLCAKRRELAILNEQFIQHKMNRLSIFDKKSLAPLQFTKDSPSTFKPKH